MRALLRIVVWASLPGVLLAAAWQDPGASALQEGGRIRLQEATDGRGGTLLRGTVLVPENRSTRAGRILGLDFVILPATGRDPAPDPIFYLAGGPGQAATSVAAGFADSPFRKRRDLVFVDQRGTGGNHRLGCALPGTPQDMQAFLEPIFQPAVFRVCLEFLQEAADLTRYTTPIAMDDLDEVRAALGYERINLVGGSYGTRAALVYMRRHPETVRTAILNGVAPIAFTNPLYHAAAAQEGLERIFAEVEADPQYRRAWPRLRAEFAELLARIEKQPPEVTIAVNGRPTVLVLDRAAFGEGLRVLMYYLPDNRRVPYLLHEAWKGNYREFLVAALQSNRGLRSILSFGMLLCVTCAEDIPRIDPAAVEAATAGTFLGSGRVRQQMAVCAFWPRGRIPDDYGEPVAVDVPVLLLSGTHDPVTPPRWGAAAARHLPNSLHLVVPGAHGVGGACIQAVMDEFLAEGSADDLQTGCVAEMRLPRFQLPD